jgi:hypothetical protein
VGLLIEAFMPPPLKRWLLLFAGAIACIAILFGFRFSDISFIAVFLILVVSVALYHAD